MAGLSADEFQLKLCENLKHQGFVNDLKSQMRNRLINELIQHSGFKLFENKSKYSSPNSQVVTEKFVNSAIISYLKRYGYEYTLSIFLPECGLNSENIISEKELLDHLMVKTSSGNSFIIHSSGSVLERLFGKSELSILSSVQKRNDDADSKNIFSRVKKDNVDTLNFNTNLNETDENVDCLLNSEKSRHYSYKERQQAEVDLQVMRLKNTEVENIKLEEKIKCGVELEKFKREIELIYQKKLETLKKKECDVDEKVKHLHASFEKETMMKRQNILLELEKLKHKENALAQKEEWLKTENDILMKKKIKFESYVQQENENIYDSRKKIEEKVTEMVDLRWQVFEKDVEIKKKEINDIKIDLNAREKKMDNVLKSYEEAKRQLTIKNNEISSLKIDLKAAESNLQNAEKQISEYRNYNKENQQLQLKNVKLKSQLEDVKSHLLDVLKETSLHKQGTMEQTSQLEKQLKTREDERLALESQLQQLHGSLLMQQQLNEDQKLIFESKIRQLVARNEELLARLTVSDNKIRQRVLRTGAKEVKEKVISQKNDGGTGDYDNDDDDDDINQAKLRLKHLNLESQKLEKNMNKLLYTCPHANDFHDCSDGSNRDNLHFNNYLNRNQSVGITSSVAVSITRANSVATVSELLIDNKLSHTHWNDLVARNTNNARDGDGSRGSIIGKIINSYGSKADNSENLLKVKNDIPLISSEDFNWKKTGDCYYETATCKPSDDLVRLTCGTSLLPTPHHLTTARPLQTPTASIPLELHSSLTLPNYGTSERSVENCKQNVTSQMKYNDFSVDDNDVRNFDSQFERLTKNTALINTAATVFYDTTATLFNITTTNAFSIFTNASISTSATTTSSIFNNASISISATTTSSISTSATFLTTSIAPFVTSSILVDRTSSQISTALTKASSVSTPITAATFAVTTTATTPAVPKANSELDRYLLLMKSVSVEKTDEKNETSSTYSSSSATSSSSERKDVNHILTQSKRTNDDNDDNDLKEW